MKVKTIAAVALVFIICMALTGCGSSSGSTASQANPVPDVPTVTVEEAHKLIEENVGNDDFRVLDVRTPKEYVLGHIEGSENIDYYADDFREKIGELDRDAAYLVYCRCGTRGAYSVSIMLDLGFSDVHNIKDGFLEWQVNWLPTVK